MYCCVMRVCLRRTVLYGVPEEHQAHGNCARHLVVILQLVFHELLESVHILQVLVHAGLTQEVTCRTHSITTVKQPSASWNRLERQSEEQEGLFFSLS